MKICYCCRLQRNYIFLDSNQSPSYPGYRTRLVQIRCNFGRRASSKRRKIRCSARNLNTSFQRAVLHYQISEKMKEHQIPGDIADAFMKFSVFLYSVHQVNISLPIRSLAFTMKKLVFCHMLQVPVTLFWLNFRLFSYTLYPSMTYISETEKCKC